MCFAGHPEASPLFTVGFCFDVQTITEGLFSNIIFHSTIPDEIGESTVQNSSYSQKMNCTFDTVVEILPNATLAKEVTK